MLGPWGGGGMHKTFQEQVGIKEFEYHMTQALNPLERHIEGNMLNQCIAPTNNSWCAARCVDQMEKRRLQEK